MARKKWRLSQLDIKEHYDQVAVQVLRQRLHNLLLSIEQYLQTHDVEDLHQLRIWLRRLRYPLEVVWDGFPKKRLQPMYDMIEELQDLTGLGRDCDVLMERLRTLQSEQGLPVAQRLMKHLANVKATTYHQIDERLAAFRASPALAAFQRLIQTDY
jgi:CHAD domain-containing protein